VRAPHERRPAAERLVTAATLAVVGVLAVALAVAVGLALGWRARAREVEVAWREQHRELSVLRARVQTANTHVPAMAAGWGCPCGAWGDLPVGATEQQREQYERLIAEHDAVCTVEDAL
jgi:cell division protein FtsB